MLPEKKNIIRGFILDEVSHVDVPANGGSRVVLWKRATVMKGGDLMKPEDLAKRLDELESKVPQLEAALKSMMSAADDAGMDAKEIDGKMVLTKRADPEYIDFDGEKILKSAIPESLLVRLEKQTKELVDIKVAAELADIKKRAVELLPNMVGTDDEKAALVKSVESIADESTRNAVMKSLVSADAAVAKSFEELGSQTIDDTDPKVRLDKMAKEKAAADGVSYHTAYAELTKSGEGKKLAAEVQSKN